MTITVPPGKKLYHGSVNRLPNGIPNRTTGSWFATNMNQSAMHALYANVGEAVVYEYTVIQPIRVIHFNSIANFNKWATNQGANKGSKVSFIVSAANKILAEKLCASGTYDGWSFPSLQKQIMICNPRKFLRLDAVYRVKSNSKNINFSIGNTGVRYNYTQNPGNLNIMWSKVPYTANKINLSNIKNIYEPDPTKIYWYFNHKTPVFVNSKGQEIGRGKNSIIFDEETKKPKGIRLKNGRITNIKYLNNRLQGNVNMIHKRTLARRIKNFFERGGKLSQIFSIQPVT